uniref:Uncharacterized protein n=2 Tax=Quercus lobata TaxID=97700 RepID=A0A7N2L6Z0_QUELO
MIAKMFVFFLLLTCFPVSNSTEKEFDYYKLVLQWPISVCNVRRSCLQPPFSEFTVHGLWPFLAPDSMVTECSKDVLTKSKVKDTIKALRKYWPSFVDRVDFDFWSYQWLKHGTCSGLDPLPYFKLAISTTIEARQLLESLNRKAYKPRFKPYQMNDLYDNFKAALVKKPEDKKVIQFKCNKKDGKFQLLEIYICVDKKGVALDCPTPKFIECGDNEMAEIRYPDK